MRHEQVSLWCEAPPPPTGLLPIECAGSWWVGVRFTPDSPVTVLAGPFDDRSDADEWILREERV